MGAHFTCIPRAEGIEARQTQYVRASGPRPIRPKGLRNDVKRSGNPV